MGRARKVNDKLLDFWLDNNLNVLFEGRHGVGKTAMIIDCFERHGLKWKYFSAATMDPWCDFVGIPRVVDDNGGKTLEYILPRDLSDDSVEALFFDEFNRSHKKIRNAVMELIQFKSINGRKFNNLKIVWAAINPHDEDSDEYHVEKLDAALVDRFHVHVNVPFEPNLPFFKGAFGTEGRFAVNWWKALDKKISGRISPRRLEYAVKVMLSGGDTSYVFPNGINIKQFEDAIKNGDIFAIMEKFLKVGDVTGAESWLKNPNIVFGVESALGKMNGKKKRTYVTFYAPLLPIPNITSLMSSDKRVLDQILKDEAAEPKFAAILDSIISLPDGTTEQNTFRDQIVIKRVEASGTTKMTGAQFENYVQKVEDKIGYSSKYYWTSNTASRWKAMGELVSSMENNKQHINRDTAVYSFAQILCDVIMRSQDTTLKKSKNNELLLKFVALLLESADRKTIEDNLRYTYNKRLVTWLTKLGVKK